MKQRPILHPPVQASHLYYRLTRVLVWAGISRYYTISGLDDFDRLPRKGTPTIFIGNHQNGMMDPMPICGFIPQQVHWLTRADVFWNKVSRHILYGYNQLPVYRQRDRVDQLRERNDIIFDVCVDRLHAGAAMGIFPEGNHNPFPSLRALKGGLAEMLARGVRRHASLKDIQVVPIGLDYENYAQWRRRLRVRAGKPIPFADLLQEDGSMNKSAFNGRVKDAFQTIMVDVQPEDAQPYLHPAVRAMRTCEMNAEQWRAFRSTLRTWEEQWQNDSSWADHVTSTHDQWIASWDVAGRPGRPEAWGTHASQTRTQRSWVHWIRPLLFLANLPSWPATRFITSFVDRSVKKLEFVATMRFGYGILLLPLTWLIWASLAALAAPQGWGWLAAAAMWLWGQGGSRLHTWAQSKLHDLQDRHDGEVFWNSQDLAPVRQAWGHYLRALNIEYTPC